jgi:hypothetical protein
LKYDEMNGAYLENSKVQKRMKLAGNLSRNRLRCKS